MGGPLAADRFEYFQWEPNSIRERTAIGIGAPIADGRQKLMQQIAMRAMKLDELDTSAERACYRLDECVANRAHLAMRKSPRGWPGWRNRHIRGCYGWVAAFLDAPWAAAKPRFLGRGATSRVA